MSCSCAQCRDVNSPLCFCCPIPRNLQYVHSIQFSCLVMSDFLPHELYMPGLPVHRQLPEFTQTPVHWVGDAMRPSHPLSSPSLPGLNLSQHQGFFKWVSSSHQVPKYWSFSFSISPSNEYSGLTFFRMNWLDLFAVQGTLESSPALQFISINSLVLSFLL